MDNYKYQESYHEEAEIMVLSIGILVFCTSTLRFFNTGFFILN